MIRVLTLAFFLVAMASPSHAHTRSQSVSDWQIDGQMLQGNFSIDARRATLLYGLQEGGGLDLDEALRNHLGRTIGVTQSGVACALVDAPAALPAAAGYLRAGLTFECPQDLADAGADLSIGAFFDLSASHLHILRIRQGDELVLERVLSGVDHQVHFGADRAQVSLGHQFTSFVEAGWSHVLSGWDHLAFLAALLLLAGRVKPIIITVTGFTLGHSLTMALVALGLLRPYGLAVEVLIGFSIAYAAMEAGARDFAPRQRLTIWIGVAVTGAGVALLSLGLGQAWPPVLAVLAMSWFVLTQSPLGNRQASGWLWRAPALAALFGLAHGAGFAGALLEYDLGGEGLIWSLFGFNLGVELGQLSAILVILLIFAALQRLVVRDMTIYRAPIVAALFGLGVFWTISRLILVA